MKTMCPPGYHHNGFEATHALGKFDTEKKVKLKQQHKVGSECELNSWPDSSVGLNRIERLNGIQCSWFQIPLRLTFYSYS